MIPEIKYNCKGQIKEGKYSPNGEILVEDDTQETGGLYIYIWPKDGSVWPETQDEAVYDYWFENEKQVIDFMQDRNWNIKWSN